MKNLARKVAPLSAAGALLVAASMVCAATGLPPVHRSGTVDYVTGGIGQAESSSFESASHDWPLTLEFAVKDKQRADFVAGVDVEVRDARQQVKLKVRSDGPFLLARLAPGHYQVDATFAGKSLHEKIVVAARHPAKAVFVWPSENGTAGS